MSTSQPNYLRLHVEPDQAMTPAPANVWRGLPQLCHAFERATGWTLHCRSRGTQPASDSRLWSASISLGNSPSPAELCIETNRDRAALADADDAAEMGAALAELLNELTRTQTALWQREAELAAGVPVISRRDEPGQLAQRLQSVLQAGASAVSCRAAGLYLLDAHTTQLKLRAAFGLPAARFLDPPRALSETRGDLEALAGHAVTLATAEQVAQWKAPEACEAAICVPVSTPTVPLGTLWIFGDRPRQFTDAQCNLVEVVAGRLAAELERQMLLCDSQMATGRTRQWHAAAELAMQPPIAPCLEGWELAGWAAQGDELGGAFYDWRTSGDDTLLAMAAETANSGLTGALTSCTLRSLFRAHAEHIGRSHALLASINRTFWSQFPGDQLASATCLELDSRNGLLGICWGGRPGMLRLGAQGHEWLCEPQTLLGLEPETSFANRQMRLEAGESLVVLGEHIETALQQCGRPLDRAALTSMLWDHRHVSAVELSELVHSFLDSHNLETAAEDYALLVIKRR